MWKALAEIWYRMQVRRFTLKIEKGTMKRASLRYLQAKDTKSREHYQRKLDEAKLK
jgi:hypothetical protein